MPTSNKKPFNLRGRSPLKTVDEPLFEEPIRWNQSTRLFSSSSKSESEETVQRRHISVTNSSTPKGFISTLKRNSLNATSTVRNSEKDDGERRRENNGGEMEIVAETEAKAVEPRKTTKAKTTKQKARQRDEAEMEAMTTPLLMDVVLLLDGSTSITETVFKGQMLEFSREFAKQMGVARNGNHLALVQFSGYCRTEFGLNDYFNTKRLEDAISLIRYMNGGTRLGGALDYTKRKVLDSARKMLPTVNKVMVVVTDGASEDDVASPAKALRDDNVQIVVVGIGPGIVQKQLETVAGGLENVYTVEDFAQLNKALAGRLKTKIYEKMVEDEDDEPEEGVVDEEEDRKKEQQVQKKFPSAALIDAKKDKKKNETTSKSVFSEESTFREF